jgi:hypothetical protein
MVLKVQIFNLIPNPGLLLGQGECEIRGGERLVTLLRLYATMLIVR